MEHDETERDGGGKGLGIESSGSQSQCAASVIMWEEKLNLINGATTSTTIFLSLSLSLSLIYIFPLPPSVHGAQNSPSPFFPSPQSAQTDFSLLLLLLCKHWSGQGNFSHSLFPLRPPSFLPLFPYREKYQMAVVVESGGKEKKVFYQEKGTLRLSACFFLFFKKFFRNERCG